MTKQEVLQGRAALERAIRLLDEVGTRRGIGEGGQAELVRRLNRRLEGRGDTRRITSAMVTRWKLRGWCPDDMPADISACVDGAVTTFELRPDLARSMGVSPEAA